MLASNQIIQNRYQLQQRLGQNAGRETWLATDMTKESALAVVLKLLAVSPQLQWDEIKLFEREARVLQQLDHPQIPRYLDSFQLEASGDELPWFVLVQERVPGRSLRERLDAGERLTPEQVQQIANSVLELLIHLHELSPPVLHRDIKPSNLMMDDSGKVYLVDFGAVQDKAKAEGATFTVVGTSGYASPEQLWGRAVPSSDLYALGATLIHLLTGLLPSEFPQKNLRLQFHEHLPKSLPSKFVQWLEKLLEPALERRFANARQAQQTLQIVMGNPAGEANNRLFWVNGAVLGGITLLGLVTLVAAPILGVVIPTWRNLQSRPRISEAKAYTGSLNRAQQAFFLEMEKFSDDINALGLGIETETENYSYRVELHNEGTADETAYSYAIARRKGLPSFVGRVVLVPADPPDPYAYQNTMAIICETETLNVELPALPIYQNTPSLGPQLYCAPSTRSVYR